MRRLTLAMIVRDAADLLPGFLEHHAGLWDDLVVVDTGSQDGSVGIDQGAVVSDPQASNGPAAGS